MHAEVGLFKGSPQVRVLVAALRGEGGAPRTNNTKRIPTPFPLPSLPSFPPTPPPKKNKKNQKQQQKLLGACHGPPGGRECQVPDRGAAHPPLIKNKREGGVNPSPSRSRPSTGRCLARHWLSEVCSRRAGAVRRRLSGTSDQGVFASLRVGGRPGNHRFSGAMGEGTLPGSEARPGNDRRPVPLGRVWKGKGRLPVGQ